MEFVKDQIRHNCHDCNAKVGEHHMAGCDGVEVVHGEKYFQQI